MGKKKYIPDNCWLICDKGQNPTQIKVTHDNNSKIYGEHLVSEADAIPGENIKPFGQCTIKGACCFQPLYWDKCNQNVKVNGYKLVFEDAYLLCKHGGKIEASFTVPASISGAPFAGGGLGLSNGMSGLDNIFGFSAAELRANPTSGLPNTTQLGNWGEIGTVQELQRLGYQITSTSQATTVAGGGHQGLDFSAYDPKGNIDILGESKTSMATSIDTPPKMNPANPSSGLPQQMSNNWLTDLDPNTNTNRIQQAMPADDATRVLNNLNNGGENVMSVASKVDGNTGQVAFYEIDANGNVGNMIDIPPANIVAGNSRAANTINAVSRSIQTQSQVAAANRYLVQNADQVARVGKVVGKGAVVIGIIIDAGRLGYTAYEDYQDDGELGAETAIMATDVAGGIAGAAAGAKIGAMVGAAGGPVGVIVGGVVGGVVGGIIGSGIGKKIGNWLWG